MIQRKTNKPIRNRLIMKQKYSYRTGNDNVDVKFHWKVS